MMFVELCPRPQQICSGCRSGASAQDSRRRTAQGCCGCCPGVVFYDLSPRSFFCFCSSFNCASKRNNFTQAAEAERQRMIREEEQHKAAAAAAKVRSTTMLSQPFPFPAPHLFSQRFLHGCVNRLFSCLDMRSAGCRLRPNCRQSQHS
jgi:hypothetical protein